jgi:hypothetical protein
MPLGKEDDKRGIDAFALSLNRPCDGRPDRVSDGHHTIN